MSATATKITRPWWDVGMTTPMGANTAGTPALGAFKQDTGWDYTPNSLPGSVDYGAGTARLGDPNLATPTFSGAPATNAASPFGYSYSNPGAGFNPWGTYEGGDSYSGSDGPGLYNVNADTKKGWGPNGQGEFDRDRVWRMTLDAARAEKLDPGAQDPATQARVKQIYLTEIARLHRDYDQTYGPQAWAGSAFAGYDKLAGGAGATQQGGSRGDGGLGGNGLPAMPTYTPAKPGEPTPDQYAQQGGTAVNPTSYDPNAGSTLPPPASGMGGGLVAGAKATAPVPTTTPTGQAAPMGAFNAGDPSGAINAFLAQHNVDVGNHSPWAEFLRTLVTKISAPIISTLPNGPNGQPANDRLANMPQMLSDLIYGNGGQVFGNLAAYGSKVGQEWAPKLGGMDAPTAEKLIATLNAFKTLGDNPYQQQFSQQQMADIFSKYNSTQYNAAQTGGKPATPNWLMDPQNDPYGIFR